MPELQIRDLEYEDLEQLIALYEHLHEADDPLPVDASSRWRSAVDDSRLIYLGGFLGGALVSTCNAAVVPNFTRGARPYAIVENVVTHSDHRRRGYGAAVLQELLERCKSCGCYKIMLLTGANRAAVHEFYESLRFDKTAKQGFIVRW